MIVILCDSFEDAKEGFDLFMDFLISYEPLSIKQVFHSSYCVETDDDLRYIFVDYRFKNLFSNICRPDFISMDEFFLSIDCTYFGHPYIII